MRDFTLKAYAKYMEAIKSNYKNIPLCKEYFLSKNELDNFCLIKHDVDRKPLRALDMAKLENQMGIKATYYFRARNHTFKPKIIKEVESLGHEIGYHYESLSDTNGNLELALEDFAENLKKFREIAPISTICMHGSPLSKYNNCTMWESSQQYNLLKNRFDILGAIMVDIDFSEIAYIGDTGRNWKTSKANRRDKVASNIVVEFDSAKKLLDYLKNNDHGKTVFQIHPERWSDHYLGWAVQAMQDTTVNQIKWLVKSVQRT